ncbi:MAG: hypothetical protein ACTSYO_02820 [Candidatus Ranarchaeia archaeon]
MLAHSDSRDYINNLHTEVGEAVGGAYLPSVHEITKMLERIGLEVVKEIDTPKLFIIKSRLSKK